MMVTTGSGAFMVSMEKARELASSITMTAQFAGVKCKSIITRMDYPYGEMVGNTCEVWEALQCMDPKNKDYQEIVKNIIIDQSQKEMLTVENGKGTLKENLVFIIFVFAFYVKMMADEPEPMKALAFVKDAWLSGRAYNRFLSMVL